MKTMQAEYKTDMKDLAKQMAERDTRIIFSMIGTVAFGVSILGVIIAVS